jgi:uncharacterized membrane protein
LDLLVVCSILNMMIGIRQSGNTPCSNAEITARDGRWTMRRGIVGAWGVGVNMFYAALKSIHLLSLVVWVGGMFFAHVCLRPALALLEGPQRLRLMNEVLRRFFAIVGVVIGLMVISGASMLVIAVRVELAPGLHFNMPLDWYAMITLGVVMIAIFGHVRAVLFKRLQRAIAAHDWAAGAAAMENIRRWVAVNLVLGAVVIVVMRLGAAG